MTVQERSKGAISEALDDARQTLRLPNTPNYVWRMAEALLALDAWASRMPDAGFNDQDPRWGWWHERPQ